jgi:hypothetical protein
MGATRRLDPEATMDPVMLFFLSVVHVDEVWQREPPLHGGHAVSGVDEVARYVPILVRQQILMDITNRRVRGFSVYALPNTHDAMPIRLTTWGAYDLVFPVLRNIAELHLRDNRSVLTRLGAADVCRYIVSDVCNMILRYEEDDAAELTIEPDPDPLTRRARISVTHPTRNERAWVEVSI